MPAIRFCGPPNLTDRQEQFEVEREFGEGALFPAWPAALLLRARRFCADPQALLPLSLPDARWPTWPARRASGGFAPRKGAVAWLDRCCDPLWEQGEI
jgi:hypothetical protein